MLIRGPVLIENKKPKTKKPKIPKLNVDLASPRNPKLKSSKKVTQQPQSSYFTQTITASQTPKVLAFQDRTNRPKLKRSSSQTATCLKKSSSASKFMQRSSST